MLLWTSQADVVLCRSNCLNCCSGTFESSEACPSSELDHYDYFKQGCEHA